MRLSGTGTTPPPSISINDVRVREGNTGTHSAVFVVRLSAPSAAPVTVTYQTADGSATAGTDYTAASGSLTFGPYIRSRPIPVAIHGDTMPEANETVFVNLSNPSNGTIARGQGKATIVNDDH